MQFQKISTNAYIIRIQRGENIVESIKKFCEKKHISGGFFYGIGAVDEVELAHYNVEKKKYSKKKFVKAFEVPNLTGSIGICEGELIIHVHAVFSDDAMNTIGGHLVEAKVSGTAELFFTKTDTLLKSHDEETGLKLFELSNTL